MPSAALARLAKALNAVTHGGDVAELIVLAIHAGVSGRQARRAAKQIDTSANAYLKLCAAAGIDPVTGQKVGIPIETEACPDLDWNRVAIQVLVKLIGGASLRSLAKDWHVSHMAVSRAKHQQPVNIDSFLKICAGLGRHPHDFLARRPPPPMFHGEQPLLQQAEKVGA